MCVHCAIWVGIYMQLAKSTVEQNYLKQIRTLEEAIKNAISGPVDHNALDAAQEKLDTLAARYQHNDTIGSGAYRLYELQAILHYYNGNHDEALDFIEQAIEVRGKKYERATRLIDTIQSGASTEPVSSASTIKPTISEVDRDILAAKSSITSAGLWSLVIGIVGTLTALGILFTGPAAIPFALFIGLVCIYFTVAGSLLTTNNDDRVLKGLLITNIVVSTLLIWTILPILVLVTSAVALKRLATFKGAYTNSLQQYDKVLHKVRMYQNTHSVFFYRSPLVVALFTVITFGFYTIYWVYKHYALIGKSTQEKTYPVLSAIFQVFTIYPLMLRIKHAATHHHYTKFAHAGWAAAGFIVLLVFSNAANRVTTDTVEQVLTYAIVVFLLSCGIAAIMSVVQRAANASNVAKLGKSHTFRTAYAGEVVMIIIGVIITIIAVGLSFYNAIVPEPDVLSPEEKSMYSRIESLRGQYNSCSDVLTNWSNTIDTSNSYEVDRYNSDWQTCENTRLELNSLVDTYNASINAQ